DVREAVASRHSIRGFLDRAVDGDVIRRILSEATRAPSGGNLQPWNLHVVAGDPLDRLKAIMAARTAEAPRGEEMEYAIYPTKLDDPYAARRFKVGEDMYGHVGIAREDREARRRWFARNFAFFGAPLALFCTVDRNMGPPQWSDLGMFLQTVMLLLRGEGLDSCAQECWAMYPQTLGDFLSIDAGQMLFCGMSIGYRDPDEPANRLISDRAPLEEVARFHGI
ncbi:MAG: nitroreductase, partial [Sphingobium sp.]